MSSDDVPAHRYDVGQRIEFGADIQGDRSGVVVKVGRTRVHVRGEPSGRELRVLPEQIGRTLP